MSFIFCKFAVGFGLAMRKKTQVNVIFQFAFCLWPSGLGFQPTTETEIYKFQFDKDSGTFMKTSKD